VKRILEGPYILILGKEIMPLLLFTPE